MVDVNFQEYGQDSLRIIDAGHDTLQFGADNGYELGVIIGLIIVLFLVVFIFVFMARKFNILRKGKI